MLPPFFDESDARIMVQSFPKTLAYLRREKRISQKEAASSLGISQALLSHYENGLREPGLRFVLEASAYFGVSVDYLLGRTDIRTPLPSTEGWSEAMRSLADMSTETLTRFLITLEETGDQEFCRRTEEWLTLQMYELLRMADRDGNYTIPREMSQSLLQAYSGLLRARLVSDKPGAMQLRMSPELKEKVEDLLRKLWEEWRDLL